MHWKNSALIVLIVVAVLLGAPAHAAKKNRYMSLDEAVSLVRDRTGGRVLSAETRDQNGRTVHHIRILSDNGKVLRFRVDAKSGKPIGRR